MIFAWYLDSFGWLTVPENAELGRHHGGRPVETPFQSIGCSGRYQGGNGDLICNNSQGDRKFNVISLLTSDATHLACLCPSSVQSRQLNCHFGCNSPRRISVVSISTWGLSTPLVELISCRRIVSVSSQPPGALPMIRLLLFAFECGLQKRSSPSVNGGVFQRPMTRDCQCADPKISRTTGLYEETHL